MPRRASVRVWLSVMGWRRHRSLRVGEPAGAELSDVVFGDPVRVGEVNVAGDQLVGVAVQLDDRPPIRAVAVGGQRRRSSRCRR